MAGERQPITPSADAAARQVVAALSAGHVQRYGVPRPAAYPSPGPPGATRQATAASPAFAVPRQAAPVAMIAREHGEVRVGQMKQPAANASSCDADARRRAATFKRKHAELIAEAAGVASEFGTDVCIYVARDGTGGSCHKFPGRPGHQQAAATIRQLVGKDVARMGLQDAKAHEARLLELRAALVRKLHDIETTRAAAAARPNKIIRLE